MLRPSPHLPPEQAMLEVDTSYHTPMHDPGETYPTEQFSYERKPQFRSPTSSNDRLAGPFGSTHRQLQTAPSLSPVQVNARTGSPVRGHSRHQSDMPFTGDGRDGKWQDTSPKRLAGWWPGNSTSVEETPSPDTTPKSKRGMPSTSTTPQSTASAPQSSFGFLASSVSALRTRLTTNTSPTTHPIGDELFDLDVDAALRPPESLAGREAFSPAAYKNLQANATGLLNKMQSAYRQRTVVLHELQVERAAEREEEEETRLRVDNLKLQLEHMAHKADEQQQAMRRLMAELEQEKKARHGERLARGLIPGEGFVVTEDLGVDEETRKHWRKSGGTDKSETSFDTDMDSVESESVFSRSRSPTVLTSATESHFDAPSSSASSTFHGNTNGKVPALSFPATTKGVPPKKDLTSLQKLMKNISGETVRQEDMTADGCSNCRGQDASVAWDTVSLLRDENRELKHRVASLEVAVDGALDLVNGVGM